MSEHEASVAWVRKTPDFHYDTYSRDHQWGFDSGVTVQASAAPGYLGNPEAIDPEEALVASIASCHMLTFLAVAARRRLTVNRYEDRAIGFMEKKEGGHLAITRVELQPRINWEGAPPSADAIAKLHESAHRNCFIANSVRCEISVRAEPRSEAPET